MQATAGQAAVGVAEVEVEADPSSAAGGAAGDWLCAWCLNRVANDGDRFRIEGQGEFTFANPEGSRFHILTFARTLGCQPSGSPTLDNTWFPGHAWSFCQCDRCSQQLGWFYSGPSAFAGLIRDRLVPASWARN